MYDILHSIFRHLLHNMTVSKDQLYTLVYTDTNCTPEEFDKAYGELYKAYLK
jgi:hypothetical protein